MVVGIRRVGQLRSHYRARERAADHEGCCVRVIAHKEGATIGHNHIPVCLDVSPQQVVARGSYVPALPICRCSEIAHSLKPWET